MKIQMLKAAFAPGPKRKTPDILEKGKIVDLPNEDAEALIDKGYAVELKASKSETPDDSWKVDELKKYAEEHQINLGEAKKKTEILEVIAAASQTA